MNQTQYTTLLGVLAVIPDPRKARGQRALAQQIVDQGRHYPTAPPHL